MTKGGLDGSKLYSFTVDLHKHQGTTPQGALPPKMIISDIEMRKSNPAVEDLAAKWTSSKKERQSKVPDICRTSSMRLRRKGKEKEKKCCFAKCWLDHPSDHGGGIRHVIDFRPKRKRSSYKELGSVGGLAGSGGMRRAGGLGGPLSPDLCFQSRSTS
eukprot:1140283-Pelagomonas_calceolata.AAC.5